MDMKSKKNFITILAVVVFLVFVPCTNNSQTGKEIQPGLTKEPVKTVVDFLKWYRENYEKISKIQMVNIPPLEDHDSVYTVNFEEIEEYLTYLKTSGFVSDKYLQQWRDFLVKAGKKLEQDKVNDGPPEGFDFDFVLWTQEINDTLEAIKNPKLISSKITQNKAVVKIDIMMRLEFKLSKQNDKWLINDIQNLGMFNST
jgi:hypothetical protein